MPIATPKLLRLLRPDQPPETRAAAILVLGEVGERDEATAEALCAGLEDPDPAVRMRALDAVGKLRIERALPQLLERIKGGGAEAEEAARAAAHLGAKAIKALEKLMPTVAPGLRRYIAAALAGGGTGRSEASAVAVLLDDDPGVVEAAARSMTGQIPSMSPAQRKALAGAILDLLSDKAGTPSARTEAAMVRLLVALDDPRAEDVLWKRIDRPHDVEVRSAALQGLGKWVKSPKKAQTEQLFACAADAEFRVAAPALMILKELPTDARAAKEWLGLLRAPDVAVRRLALDKVGERDSAEVAQALLAQANHPDRTLREAAIERLVRLRHGREALTQALADADSVDRAWLLARALAPAAGQVDGKTRDDLFAQTVGLLEKGDRRVEPLLFLLKEADAGELRDRLEQRALALRKKKDYAAALLYLRRLSRDPASGFAIRLEEAACGLKVSDHDLGHEARAADPSLQQFVHLCQEHGEEELFRQIDKIKWLEPADLHYLGFHLAEQSGPARKLAAKVLALVLKRSPRSKLAQAARSKLRQQGLE